jgi:hypothetical protein
MIRFVGITDSGRLHIGLGIDAENLRRLKAGQSILISLDDLRLPNTVLSVSYGDTIEDIQVQWAHAGFSFQGGPPPPQTEP